MSARPHPVPTAPPSPGELHVWLIAHGPGSRAPAQARALLSEDEKARAARFHHERHRVAYLTSHTALREILGAALGRDPGALGFVLGPHGKPALAPLDPERAGLPPRAGSAKGLGAPAAPPLHFNLSDTDGLGLVALSVDGPLGVDVERHRSDASRLDVARRFFSAAEVRALEALPEAERMLAFHRVWTRKEAYVKALGLGLALELSSFDVSHDPGPGARLVATRHDPAAIRRWRLVDLDVGSEHSGAAVRLAPPAGGPAGPVRYFAWGPGATGNRGGPR